MVLVNFVLGFFLFVFNISTYVLLLYSEISMLRGKKGEKLSLRIRSSCALSVRHQ